MNTYKCIRKFMTINYIKTIRRIYLLITIVFHHIMINKSVPFFQRVNTTLTSRPFLCQQKPTAAKTSLFLPEDQWRTCFTECVNRTTFLTWWRTPRVSAIIMHTAIVQPVLLTTAQQPLIYLANFFLFTSLKFIMISYFFWKIFGTCTISWHIYGKNSYWQFFPPSCHIHVYLIWQVSNTNTV